MKFRINYSQVISQVNTMNDEISQLLAQVRLLKQAEQNCRSAWKGEAADVFYSKLNALYTDIERTQKQMASLVSTIKYCADTIQQQDEEEKRRAEALKTGH